MNGPNSPEQVAEQLRLATKEARAQLAETRGLVKDLINLNIYTRSLIEREVDAEVARVVAEQMDAKVEELGEVVKTAMRKAVKKVELEFQKLEDIFLGRDPESKALKRATLEAVIREGQGRGNRSG